MNRRDAILSWLAMPLMASFGGSLPKKWGAVNWERWRALDAQGITLHVWYRGEDVTDRCRFADDSNGGYAELFHLDSAGRKYIDVSRDEIAIERVRGIEIREGARF